MFAVLRKKSSPSLDSLQARRDEAAGAPKRNQRSVSFGAQKKRSFVSCSDGEEK